MPDTLLDLADAVVSDLAAAYRTVQIAGRSYPVTVAWTDDGLVDLADAALRDPLVWVIDAGEAIAAKDGLCCEEFKVLLVVQQKLPADADPKIFARALSALAASIRRHCKSADVALALEVDEDELVCVAAERPVPRNLDEWHTKRRFYGEILTTWRRY